MSVSVGVLGNGTEKRMGLPRKRRSIASANASAKSSHLNSRPLFCRVEQHHCSVLEIDTLGIIVS